MASRRQEWLQLNLALVRQDGSALPAARFILREIEHLVAGKSQVRFFFQRKPPDLRIRFFGDLARLTKLLRPVISRGKARGHILESFRSVYEPENRLFGGPACMKPVHDFWCADSLAWIALDRLSETENFAVSQETLIASVLDDVFWRVLADDGEVWDTWCNLIALLQTSGAVAETTVIVPPLEVIRRTASTAQAEIVLRYQEQNAALARGFSRAWQSGRMQCGIRSILPYVALFTLNRHGIVQAGMVAMAATMAAARNPKRHLRGARLDWNMPEVDDARLRPPVAWKRVDD